MSEQECLLKTENTPQPQGQRFTLDVQLKKPREDCIHECGDRIAETALCIFLTVFTVCGLLYGAGLLISSGYIGYGFLCLVPVVVIIILVLYCCGCCESKVEKWLKYILIINIDLNKLYLIEESTFKRWRFTCV
eukprot:515088_1